VIANPSTEFVRRCASTFAAKSFMGKRW